ncbi:GlxA family transcriptional regulator [Phreatobacter sp. AB_2022a]|uniref:GlxA family transcriptional regulator n=1 Tax=Phreatobacter sp. AB_2022a TaxID=3003134 RepID=UPI0022873F76|nr:helix-turn-helix domain-containing protein [Phreatobacter sp. AB_2022a]MCZ0734875.1 helix-turn-helix domain-containing protein [Phreatobacter sp. AB_2022a]
MVDYDMKLSVLALDGAFDTGLAVLLDTFSMANELAIAQGRERLPFEVKLIGVRPQIRTALGLTASVESAGLVRNSDWIVVPALNAKTPPLLLEALARPDVLEAIDFLRAWRNRDIGIAGACVGTFLLAEAGILDGVEATTTWSLSPLFRQRFPAVRLDETQLIAGSDRVVTAGSMMGHLDLALWLVRQASPEMAALVARFMLIDTRQSQARYIIPDHLAHADPLIERFDRWARDNLHRGFSLQEAASSLSVSARTLQRRSEAILGKSPLAFVQDIRVEEAQRLMSMGRNVESIAAQVGYADTATLRTLLRRRLGRGVRELKAEIRR